ncbi:hypothetical protein [Microbacterium esteraromaticum]|uniref:hypothetical protein n=1 Tax=Microbacterium esteraromaticum TaxID=57043 RepID=UPI001C982BE9|nr:hypothetical protein [Microbacterium esteraromaticum]MBY6062672.1 hypothetical protein [Microbacterium esteraromaticum]
MMQGRTVSGGRTRLRADLTLLGIIGALLLAAIVAGGASLYKQFYSPPAFVHHYLDLLASGRAADALLVPGVARDLAVLEDAGLHGASSEALLRQAALAPLTDIEVISHIKKDDEHVVRVAYEAGGIDGTSTFTVVQDGWLGVAPNWRFEQSPLAEIELTVRGSDAFAVNGFAIDRRQIIDPAENADPLAPLHLLVLTPGLYSVSVDTAIASTPGVSVLADISAARTPVDVQAQPTPKLVEVVQQQVEQFLTTCAQQEVLQPTSCPFGLEVQNRLAPGSAPNWSIITQPEVSVVPDGAGWAIPATDAVARIDVDIQSLYDGSVHALSEDVPFQVSGTIAVLADGSLSIRVGSPGS